MLTAQQLAHTNDLHLVIRHLLAGLGHGIHSGKDRGAGVEFSEYRSYSAGDEWRRIDWKLMARTDRYFVREAERDSHVALWLCVDASASMQQYSSTQLIKWHYARIVAATLASIAHRQGDAVGILLLHNQRIQVLPAIRGARHLQRLFALLLRTEPHGTLPDITTWQSVQRLTRSPSLIFAISDFLDCDSSLQTMLNRWRALGHDVRAIALQTDIEHEGLLSARQTVFDGEDPAQLHQFDDALKSDYVARYHAHYEQWKIELARRNIPAWIASIEQSPETFLRHCLRQVRR